MKIKPKSINPPNEDSTLVLKDVDDKQDAIVKLRKEISNSIALGKSNSVKCAEDNDLRKPSDFKLNKETSITTDVQVM